MSDADAPPATLGDPVDAERLARRDALVLRLLTAAAAPRSVGSRRLPPDERRPRGGVSAEA